MRLVPITLDRLVDAAPVWGPFVEGIAKRQRCHLQQRLDDVYSGNVHLILIVDDDNKATGLVGVAFMQRGDDTVARLVWTTGKDRKRWLHLYPDLEQYCRGLGCRGMEAVARRGWVPFLKSQGYRITHVELEKDF